MYSSTLNSPIRTSIQAPVFTAPVSVPLFQNFVPRVVVVPTLNWRIEEDVNKGILLVTVDMPGVSEADKSKLNLRASWLPTYNGAYVFDFKANFDQNVEGINILSHSEGGYPIFKGEYAFRSTPIDVRGVYNINKPEAYFIDNGQLKIYFDKIKSNLLGVK